MQRPIPYVRLLVQPASVYRMRYKAENRKTFLFGESSSNSSMNEAAAVAPTTSGNIQTSGKGKGNRKKATATSDDVIYPKLEIVNGRGPATLIVSCVNKTPPYHVHPHKLVGEFCKSGVAIINIKEGETIFELTGISIEFTKKSEIEESINELRSKNVDPFCVGFEFNKSNIDLTQLRLCFQVYLRDSLDSNQLIKDKYHILTPIVSNVISNTPRQSLLIVAEQFNLTSCVTGGVTIPLFLKKLANDHKPLNAKFYDDFGWSSIVKGINIHYQAAVSIKVPPYKDLDIKSDAKVSLKLYVPFANDAEKAETIRKMQTEDDNGSGGSSLDVTEMVQPDGKYESRIIEFTYTPQAQSLKRKIDQNGFYEISEQNEKDSLNEMSEESKRKMAKRSQDVLMNSCNVLCSMPEVASQDLALTNNLLKYPPLPEATTQVTYSSDDLILREFDGVFDQVYSNSSVTMETTDDSNAPPSDFVNSNPPATTSAGASEASNSALLPTQQDLDFFDLPYLDNFFETLPQN